MPDDDIVPTTGPLGDDANDADDAALGLLVIAAVAMATGGLVMAVRRCIARRRLA